MTTRKATSKLAGAKSLTKQETKAYEAGVSDGELGLQSPWIILHKGLYNLFAQDPDITVAPNMIQCEGGVYETHISSSNYEKLSALKKIIRNETKMGNITARVVFDYDAPTDDIGVEDWKAAFAGNPLFKDIIAVPTPTGGEIDYVLFARDILTYYIDDITDLYGNKHIIVADLVKQVANETSNINICTEYNGEAE